MLSTRLGSVVSRTSVLIKESSMAVIIEGFSTGVASWRSHILPQTLRHQDSVLTLGTNLERSGQWLVFENERARCPPAAVRCKFRFRLRSRWAVVRTGVKSLRRVVSAVLGVSDFATFGSVRLQKSCSRPGPTHILGWDSCSRYSGYSKGSCFGATGWCFLGYARLRLLDGFSLFGICADIVGIWRLLSLSACKCLIHSSRFVLDVN